MTIERSMEIAEKLISLASALIRKARLVSDPNVPIQKIEQSYADLLKSTGLTDDEVDEVMGTKKV